MKSSREFKGKSLLQFPSVYTVIDIETSGLTPSDSEIIEISAVRFRDFQRTDVFSTLIKPKHKISAVITNITGITNGMVKDAPDISQVMPAFYEFIGDDILMGYNVHFDINFLYDAMLQCMKIPLSNDFVDVLRFARRALPELSNRKQTTVAEYYGISAAGAHRAERDCEICNECYLRLMEEAALKKVVKS